MIKTLLIGLGLAASLATGALASGAEQKPAKDIKYSFEGPFGKYDPAQLQRGYKVYKEVCASCHALQYVTFRSLGEPGALGYTKQQIEALAAEFKVQDGPDEKGEMFERPGLPADHIPSPFPNKQAAKAANGGALPPDLSLITKSRAGWTGTINQLLYGMGGPEYVYSVLVGYEQVSEHDKGMIAEGKYYNPYFANGVAIGMPPPLSDGQVTFDDSAANTVDAMARDVSAFLAWTAEPKLEARKKMGFNVLIFLAVFAALLYLVKKQIWSKLH